MLNNATLHCPESDRMPAALGTLERVDLRAAWASEAQHFTPWLASEAGLKLLGDTIGVELELEAKEHTVGPFRADILAKCTDTPEDHWVLIENQLQRTDHIHLGQLLTYAAGLQAITIIWLRQGSRQRLWSGEVGPVIAPSVTSGSAGVWSRGVVTLL